MRFFRSTLPYLVPKPNSDAIATLPTELLQDIGFYLDTSSLKDFSATSQALRGVLLPLIVTDVHITSMDRLKDLSEGSDSTIALIRNLTITLNIEFFDAWREEPSLPLARILSKTPNLKALVFQASNSPYDTPWNRLNVRDDAARGISLGLTDPSWPLPTSFERLTHLEVQTISTDNLDILLRRAPNLVSLAVTLPDGLTESEMASLIPALDHVPQLKELTVSISKWEPCGGLAVKEVLAAIANKLPFLETLDLRTTSYDMIDGVLAYKCVEVDSLSYEDFAPIVPLFPNLRILRLPIQSDKGDATASSLAIAQQLPQLELISWMECVALVGGVDDYIIHRTPTALDIKRLGNPIVFPTSAANITSAPRHPRQRGFALFDYSFASTTAKSSFVSDLVMSCTAVVVISSLVIAPIFAVLGY